MTIETSPQAMAAGWALVGTMLGPLLAAIRILTVISCGALMAGVTTPWRYRIAASLLLGWAAGSSGAPIQGPAALLAGSEIAFGAALGMAAGALLLSLKLAGELIDDRLRLSEAASESMVADGEMAGPCVRLLGSLGLLLVVFGGSQGDLPVLEGLLECFRSVPAGKATEVWQDWRAAISVLGGGLDITIRTALPVLAAITIIDWCQVLIARAAPTAPAALAATAVKPLLGLAVLVATFGGACEAVIESVRSCLAGGAGG